MIRRLRPYVARKQPSPYLLEYLYAIYFAVTLFSLFFILVFIFFLISPDTRTDALFVLALWPATIIAVLLCHFIFYDRVGFLYLLDKRRNKKVTVRGKILGHSQEVVEGIYREDRFFSNKVHILFPGKLMVCRVLMYYSQPGQDIKITKEIDEDGDEVIVFDERSKDQPGILRTVTSIHTAEDWDTVIGGEEIEMICWRRSKILVEIRPVAGLDYAPEVLASMERINNSYP